jgi:hypothetical protein
MEKSPLPGVNVLLMGASGSGKTYAIRTLIKAGITPFCIFTEPGYDTLGDVSHEELHWRYIAPASQSWANMIAGAKNVNQLSFESITKLSDPTRSQYSQFVDFLTALNNYTCDRGGEVYGDVCKWGTERAIVVDGLTGVGIMAMGLVVGSKPVRHQGDWGIAMQLVANLFQKLCTDTRCHFVLISHVDRETDEIVGGTKIMAATLGRKLAPVLPRFFSDVILSERQGTKFTWSTASVGADLKARNLPVADGLPPDFGAIIASWKKQGGVIEVPDKEPIAA